MGYGAIELSPIEAYPPKNKFATLNLGNFAELKLSTTIETKVTLHFNYESLYYSELRISELKKKESIKKFFMDFEGKNISMPERYFPNKDFLEYHHKNIFRK